MPNDVIYGYPNGPYNQSINYNPYFNIQNKINELEKRIKILENKINSLENENSLTNDYEYQTSMHMM